MSLVCDHIHHVALRKESVDRNRVVKNAQRLRHTSLSARRAWIEMLSMAGMMLPLVSLSARRAWIEIVRIIVTKLQSRCVALRKESMECFSF